MGSSASPTEGVAALDDPAAEAILTHGSLELEGRLLTASNASFLGRVQLDGVTLRCIYKPIAGERPLWDFPDGTLAGRERAARIISEAGGWQVVPPTVLRDGRFGQGMVQQWVDIAADDALVDVVEADFDEGGWIAVLEAEDQRGRPVLLVHADDPGLRSMAVFDVVINNADRKGGHVLVPDGAKDGPRARLRGCDHGVSLHAEQKLRTVLWGWAGEQLREQDRESLERLAAALGAGLRDELRSHLTEVEMDALATRVASLSAAGVMPTPDGSWPAIPWPAF